MYAYRFASGKGKADELCEKVGGECTGKSTLPWSIDSKGTKTDLCPMMLLRVAGQCLQFFARCNKWGLPDGMAWNEMPARWMAILTLLQYEEGRKYSE